jgi:hypothetical protein
MWVYGKCFYLVKVGNEFSPPLYQQQGVGYWLVVAIFLRQ